MKNIRAFVEGDIPRVADLYQRTFLQPDPAQRQFTVQQVSDEFTEIFFRNPWREAKLDSLVCESADGRLLGFLGITPRQMSFHGRPVLAAVSVHHMVEPTPMARLAGVQLLKAFTEGPQDFWLTDGANDLGKKVWEGLGGTTAWLECFVWRRVLQPGSYALTGVGNRIKKVRPLTDILKPIGWGADRVLSGLLPGYFEPNVSGATESELDIATLLASFAERAAEVSLRPIYDERSLGWLLARAAKIKGPGDLQKVAVRRNGGKVIGWYLYYLRAGAISEVLQIAAERASIGEVLDHLCAHAAQRGAVAVSGRIEPNLMDALAERERRISFRVAPSKVLVHARNPDLLRAVYKGDAFLTKLEGEMVYQLQDVVQAILFDLDGTLWDRDGAVHRLVQAQHRDFSELADIPHDHYVERVLALDNHGLGEKGAVYRQVVAEFGLAAELAGALHDHFWATYHAFYEPFPEVFSTLRYLAGLGLKLGIITNGNTVTQEAKIVGLGLVPLMDTILISEREGVRKPDRAIFERALQRLGVRSDAAWFVGDHPDADVRGAHEAGLTAVLRRSWSTASIHASHVISSLDELIPLIQARESATLR